VKALITGGAGFIGSNVADKFLHEGHELIVIDNLSRAGSQKNLDWLRSEHGDFAFHQVDVRDFEGLKQITAHERDLDAVLHFAAQVAVTRSVDDPREDFEVNALGTLNLLEAIRSSSSSPAVLYTSTNKVYGDLQDQGVEELETRYKFADLPHGVSEVAPLDFYSPYGCSKGVADQYMKDYNRIFGLPTVVFRNSCIYGQRQFGIEDQGWVAWFVIAAVLGKPITIYGNGKQVRDLLHIDDLVRAFLNAIDQIEHVQGGVYNVGGGPDNTLSIWKEFGPLLEEITGRELSVEYGAWRPGDQPVYISDVRKAAEDLKWVPQVGVRQGIERLYQWVEANRDLF
jgi:CDP-paratose 2-epimerase